MRTPSVSNCRMPAIQMHSAIKVSVSTPNSRQPSNQSCRADRMANPPGENVITSYMMARAGAVNGVIVAYIHDRVMLEHDPEKCVAVFPRDKRKAFARRSCSKNKLERHVLHCEVKTPSPGAKALSPRRSPPCPDRCGVAAGRGGRRRTGQRARGGAPGRGLARRPV